MSRKKRDPEAPAIDPGRSVIDSASALIVVAMNDVDAFAEVDVEIEDFPLAWQQECVRVIRHLHEANDVVDVVTVAESLERTFVDPPKPGEKWLPYLGKLFVEVAASPSNAHAYGKFIHDWTMRSKAAAIAQNLITKCNDGVEASDEAIRGLMELHLRDKITDGPIGDSISDAIDDLDNRHTKKGIYGVPYGIKRLDEATGGMGDQHLIVLAARPAMGKTAFSLCTAIFNRRMPCGYISTEQPRKEMINRLAAIHGGVSAHAMRLGQLADEDWKKVVDAYAEIKEWPLYMNDAPEPTIDEIARQARRWRHRYKINYLIVDYLQHVKAPHVEKRHEEVGAVARGLKRIGRELDIPVLALSQINRAVDSRGEKRPTISDMRESGDIEQEADLILSIYRDEVYFADARKGEVELAILKNRHGPLGKVTCHFNGPYLRFEDFGLEQVDESTDMFSRRAGAS